MKRIAGELPKYKINGKVYHFDERQRQLRRVDWDSGLVEFIDLVYWSAEKPEISFVCKEEHKVLIGIRVP